jgi:hypothetical protein
VAAVAGVEHDARDAEPELPRQRELPFELARRVGEMGQRRAGRDTSGTGSFAAATGFSPSRCGSPSGAPGRGRAPTA